MTVHAFDVRKAYGEFTLSISDFRVQDGQALGLVGNNGAGKTTFLRLVLDLIQADAGHVSIDGTAVTQATDWKARTASFLGDSFLIDFLTPDEYWRFVGSTYELAPEEVDVRLDAFRNFYTDEPIGATTKYIRDLSQGNRNKVGLVGALLVEPDLLVLDEPFASLDPRSQIQLKTMLEARRGTATMLISSHDLGHVTDVCERIAILEGGTIVRDEPTDADTLTALKHYFAETIRPREAA
jgi:ABC-2 type transport system ATP-binding protein